MSIAYLRSLQNGHFLPLVGGEIPEAGEVVEDDGEQGLSVVVGLLQAGHESAAEFLIQNLGDF